jgi:hypothetical protein
MKKNEVVEYVKYMGDLHKKFWLEIMKGRLQFDDLDTDWR